MKRNKKRIFTLIITIIFILTSTVFLTACTDEIAPEISEPPTMVEGSEPDQAESRDPLRIVATIFPQYDFIRQIAGDRVELTMLISPGAESHGFEPTPRDMIALNEADILIYVGGHGDDWVDNVIESLGREDMRRIALVDLVDTLDVEHHHDHHHDDCDDHDCDHDDHSHAHDHHHDDCDDHDCDHDDHSHAHDHHHDDCDDHDCDHDDHSHAHDHHHDDCDDHDCEHDHHHHDCDHDDHDCYHHHHDGIDEHVWTSPQNAILIVQALTDILAGLDPANADFFHENSTNYIQELEALDAAFAEVVAEGVRHTVIFGDRFPFRYLTDAYGLTYHAAFVGCSTDTQASPATIAFLIEKVEAENIPVVFYIEFSNQMIANVIAEATGATLLEFHSAHNVSHADFNAGVTYLDLMWNNVENLREALS